MKEVLTLIERVPLWQIGLLIQALAFTVKQRNSIRERDQDKCQFPAEHSCGGRLEVHHILPQRYSKEIGILNPDYPENGLTICANSHQEIHPDMKTAMKNYGMDKDSFKKAFTFREELLEKRQIYWDDKYDRKLSATAVKRTQRAEKDGWSFPPKKNQK